MFRIKKVNIIYRKNIHKILLGNKEITTSMTKILMQVFQSYNTVKPSLTWYKMAIIKFILYCK